MCWKVIPNIGSGVRDPDNNNNKYSKFLCLSHPLSNKIPTEVN